MARDDDGINDVDNWIGEVIEILATVRGATRNPVKARSASVAITHLETAQLWADYVLRMEEPSHGEE